MKLIKTTTLAVLGLALAACTSPDRFGPGGLGGAGGLGARGTAAGDVVNPASPAYFQDRVGDRVLFAVDQHTVSPEARGTLDAQAAWLANNPEYHAIIEGHADEQGTRQYNLDLSARRASSVQEYLVSRGVSPSRLTTIPYGKERPVEICSTEACYRQNRRAVTVLSAGLTG